MNGPIDPDQVALRAVTERDLPILYEHQLDPDANRMAAFTARDREGFMTHWRKIMNDASVIVRAVTVDGELAGNIVGWEQDGEQEVGYWIDKAFWGKGVATSALSRFLEDVSIRPLSAHVAANNNGSIRVLEKCGFTISSPQTADTEEVILTLE